MRLHEFLKFVENSEKLLDLLVDRKIIHGHIKCKYFLDNYLV